MSFQPRAGDTLELRTAAYRFLEHPAAPGMPYGQEGRQGIVYKLEKIGRGRQEAALKVFRPRFRDDTLLQQPEAYKAIVGIPGLSVAKRTVLSERKEPELIAEHSELNCAVLMPWVEGPTWLDILAEKRALSREEAVRSASALAETLLAMEQRRLAHCDLSAANVMLPGWVRAQGHAIELVDAESMYGPEWERPGALPLGTPGYASQAACRSGVWDAYADRLSGAILLSEMLGWADASVREAAWGESYFSPEEVQHPSARLDRLVQALSELYGEGVSLLLKQAWENEALSYCPSFAQWAEALRRVRAGERVSAPKAAKKEGPCVLLIGAEAAERKRRLERHEGAHVLSARSVEEAEVPGNVTHLIVFPSALPKEKELAELAALQEAVARKYPCGPVLYILIDRIHLLEQVVEFEERLTYDKACVIYSRNTDSIDLIDLLAGGRDADAVKHPNYAAAPLHLTPPEPEAESVPEPIREYRQHEELKSEAPSLAQLPPEQQSEPPRPQEPLQTPPMRQAAEPSAPEPPRTAKTKSGLLERVKSKWSIRFEQPAPAGAWNSANSEQRTYLLGGKRQVKLPKQGVIVVTGDRRSGVSSTAANFANLLSGHGSVLILDFDVKRRGVSRFFPEAMKRLEDERQTFGLYAVLNNPRLIEDVMFVEHETLSLITLTEPYVPSLFGAQTERKIGEKTREELLEPSRFYALLQYAKTLVDWVIVDLPSEIRSIIPDVSIYADYVVLCTNNSVEAIDELLSVVLAEMMQINEVAFLNYVNRGRIVLTNYETGNRWGLREMTEETAEKLIREYGPLWDLSVIGSVPYSPNFSLQLQKGRLLSSGELRDSYMRILERL